MPYIDKKFYIVKESPLRIISKCRSHSKGTFFSYAAGICLIFILLNWIPEIMSLELRVTVGDVLSQMTNADARTAAMLPSTPLVVYIYSMLFTGAFRLSEALYTITYIRNRKADYRAIGESFGLYLKTFAVFVIQIIIISFWSLFFIIPGILAALNFSQSFYVLADDPSKNPFEVLAESKLMMAGNRMAYVRLMIVYLPYIIAAYIPALAAERLTATAGMSALPLTLTAMLTEIPIFIAMGYTELGRCVFYELIINNGFEYFRYAGQDAFRDAQK